VTTVRYGVIADVHANLPALEAVLAALRAIRVDAYICAGDLVGYGPQPNECVEAVRRLGALSDDRCERLARESLRWTRTVLDDEAGDYLTGMPRRAELPEGVVVAHGSLDDPQEYILGIDRAAVELAHLAEAYPTARALVLGHTHRAFATDGLTRSPRISTGRRVAITGDRPWLLNPGAVGQSRESLVRARFMVLDLGRREAVFHAVRHDVRRTRALLRRERLPTRSLHLAPWRLKAVLRPAIRAARRARATFGRR
jgi:predicted phosphodiesterase